MGLMQCHGSLDIARRPRTHEGLRLCRHNRGINHPLVGSSRFAFTAATDLAIRPRRIIFLVGEGIDLSSHQILQLPRCLLTPTAEWLAGSPLDVVPHAHDRSDAIALRVGQIGTKGLKEQAGGIWREPHLPLLADPLFELGHSRPR